jgi:ribosome-binding factor A
MPENPQRHDRLAEYIRAAAAEYLARESNRGSLITVTGVDLSPKNDHARILITVLPVDREEAAIEFAERKANDCRLYFMKKVKMNRPPKFHFAIDIGEKNRQKIDLLTAEAVIRGDQAAAKIANDGASKS